MIVFLLFSTFLVRSVSLPCMGHHNQVINRMGTVAVLLFESVVLA